MKANIKIIFDLVSCIFSKDFFRHMIFMLPDNKKSRGLKKKMLIKMGYDIKDKTFHQIGYGFDVKNKIIFGDNLGFNNNVMISSTGNNSIYIGDDVMIGPNTVIKNSNHGFKNFDIPMTKQSNITEDIIIENDVWIASNCVILAGAIIKKGCIVAAGAIVTKGIYPEYSIIGGVPAKIIGNRKDCICVE